MFGFANIFLRLHVATLLIALAQHVSFEQIRAYRDHFAPYSLDDNPKKIVLSSFLIRLTVHTCQSVGHTPHLVTLYYCLLQIEVGNQHTAYHEGLVS